MTENATWLELARSMRPGSKTVLFRPLSVEIVVEFARRGFRLLVVHSDEDLLRRCKTELRAQGLSSLLMGCYPQADAKDLSTAKDFYELFCCFESLEGLLEVVRVSLRSGGFLVGAPGTLGDQEKYSEHFLECSKTLPADLLGYRLT